jgi:hypothetical protein
MIYGLRLRRLVSSVKNAEKLRIHPPPAKKTAAQPAIRDLKECGEHPGAVMFIDARLE